MTPWRDAALDPLNRNVFANLYVGYKSDFMDDDTHSDLVSYHKVPDNNEEAQKYYRSYNIEHPKYPCTTDSSGFCLSGTADRSVDAFFEWIEVSGEWHGFSYYDPKHPEYMNFPGASLKSCDPLAPVYLNTDVAYKVEAKIPKYNLYCGQM